MLTNLIATVFITLSTNWIDLGVINSGGDSFRVKAGVIQTNYVAEIEGIPVKLNKVEFCRELIFKQEKEDSKNIIFYYSPSPAYPLRYTNLILNTTNLLFP